MDSHGRKAKRQRVDRTARAAAHNLKIRLEGTLRQALISRYDLTKDESRSYGLQLYRENGFLYTVFFPDYHITGSIGSYMAM